MEINQENINKLVDERLSVLITELSKELIKEHETLDEINHSYINKIINYTVDGIISKINKLHIENTINIMFIKDVLYSHGLSNDECYNNYKEEWHRLNPSTIKDDIKDISKKYSEIKNTVDSVNNKACDHDKVYDKYILTSNPPQQQWKCKKCGEVGIDIIGNSSNSSFDFT